MDRYVWLNVLSDFISTEYLIFAAYAVFLIVIFHDYSLKRKDRSILLVFCLISLVQTFCKFIDYSIGMDSIPGNNAVRVPIRFACATAVYILRPVMIAFAPYVFTMKKHKNKLYYLPLLLNTVIYAVNIRTGICFVIAPDNHFTGHILRFLCPIVSAHYFAHLVVDTLRQSHLNTVKRKLVACLNLSIILVASLGEVIGDVNILSTSILVALILHYGMFFVFRSSETILDKDEELKDQKNALMISQIQPHFVYNTLSAIYYLTQTDAEKAGDTVLKFSDYLRQNLLFASYGSQLIPIEDELHHVQLYTDIEHLRFPKIDIEYQIDDSNYNLPPLCIQPLVENAIKHGVRGVKNGKVSIWLYRGADSHVIVITDNGVGMNVETLPAAPSRREDDSDAHTGLGLSNVIERVRSLCNGTVKVDSAPGDGTTITINIPIEKMV